MNKHLLFASLTLLFIFISPSIFSQQWTVLVMAENGKMLRDGKLIGPLGEEYPVDEKCQAIYAKHWAPDITVKAAGYRPQKVNLAKFPQNSVVTVQMKLMPAEYEPLNIYVYDKVSKKPVPDAFVSVIPGESGATNSSGYAKTGHRQLPGEYVEVRVIVDGYKNYRGQVLISETQRLEGSIVVPGQKTAIYLEKGTNKYNVTTIIVDVLDDETDKPVGNASVKMTLSDNTVFTGSTNAAGEAKFSDSDVGFEGTRARVVVTHKDYEEKWSDITEDLTTSSSTDDRRFLVYVKRKSDWNGVFSDNIASYQFSGGGGKVSATWSYSVSDAKGNCSLTSTKVEGNTATGTWKGSHEDNTKSGSRSGTFTLTLNGNSITGSLVEDTPKWSYKEGYSASNVSSSMVKGKQWPVNISRKN